MNSPRLTRVWRADLRECLGGCLGGNAFETIDAAFASVDRSAAKLVRPQTAAVLAREDCCLASFQKAKHYGIPRIYIMPTAHHATVERLIRRDAAEFPQLFNDQEIERDFAPARTARKDAELKIATHIVCPSEFVMDSLQTTGTPMERLIHLPFGVDTSFKSAVGMKRESVFLYVGRLSARKGVHRLIRIWKQMGAYRTHRLRLVGELALPQSFIADYQSVFEHRPRIARELLSAEYSKAQAFVFNALADGFGHVLGEAMACGTPVLASRNCGAPELIGEGRGGLLFDYGDDEALGSALDWVLSHPTALAEMGASARTRAHEQSWDHFERKFLTWIHSVA